MKRFIFSSLLLFVALPLLVITVSDAATNLIAVNPAFENGTFYGWGGWNQLPPYYRVQSAIRYNGNYAAKVDYTETVGHSSYPLYTKFYYPGDVTLLKVSSALRVDQATGGANLSLHLFWVRDPNYDNFETVVLVEDAPAAWHLRSVVVSVPTHTKQFSFMYRVNGNGVGGRLVAYMDASKVEALNAGALLPFVSR